MSKKIISVLLVFSMILSLFTFTVSAESDTALIISAPSSAVPGDTVNVTVSIPQSTNAVSGSFVFTYDNKNLEISAAAAGAVLNDYNVNINKSYSENSVKLTFDGDKELTDGGIIMDLAFNVVQGASGTAEFKTEKFKLYDADYNAVSTNTSSSAAIYIINDAKMQLSIDGAKTAVTGDEITVTVNLSNPAGVCGGSFNLVYDSDKLMFRSAAAGTALSGFTKQLNKSYAENKIRLTWAGSNQISASGTILTVVFKVRIGVQGTAEFAVEKLKLADINAASLDCAAEGLKTEITCNHSVMDWIVTTEPTCLADGEETYMCGCGYATDTRIAKATGHQNMQWVITKDAACGEDGEKTYTCLDCGYVEKSETVAAHGHEYEEIVTPPTKAEKGYTTHKCKYCGDSYTDSEVEALGYQITYDANGGENAPAEQTKKHGEDILLSDIIPTRTGYTFLGWATDKKAENAQYYAGNTYAQDEDAVFYALWQANEYTVTYIVDGETVSVQSYNYGDMINAAAEPTKKGYTFSGWSDIPITMPAENIEITGSFTVNSYTVTFDANGGENAPAEITDTYLKEVTIPEEIPEKENCSFIGWAKKKTAKKADYKVGDTIALEENITLYAVWQGIWNGTDAAGVDGGRGTKTNPYRIATAEQLAYLAERVNAGDEAYNSACYILTNNIVLNDISNIANWATQAPANEWTPIGRSDNPFCGTFDGNGYTVSGLYINKTGDSEDGGNHRALFGFVTNGFISNIGIESGYLKVYNYSGGIIGGSCGATVKNCFNKAAIVGNINVGGIIGALDSKEGEGTVIDCYNEGEISAYSYSGGVVGAVSAKNKIKINNCSNRANVNGADSKLGGIAGYVKSVVSEKVEILNCYNNGNVTSNGTDIAGIAGFCDNVKISDSHNIGTISTSVQIISGIAANCKKTDIVRCYNGGIINATTNNAHWTLAAGIVSNAIDNSLIEYCYNYGFIKAAGRDNGGIAASISATTIRCCYNVSSIESYQTASGIVACISNGALVKNCYNTGTVKTNCESSPSAGIVAYYDDTVSYVENCINYGAILSTKSTCYAISPTENSANAKNCYYVNNCGGTGIGTALNHEQLRKGSSYAGFTDTTNWTYNFADEWMLGTNPSTNFPMLKNMDNLSALPIEFDLNGGEFDEYTYNSRIYASGINITRTADTLVIYNTGGTNTGVSKSGTEIAVNARGVVVSKVGWNENNIVVPQNGFVLSGHGIMAAWLDRNVETGDKVYYDSSNCEVKIYKKNPVITYAYGHLAYLPTPYKEGYVFSGWCDEDGNIITYNYTFSNPNGVKLTAKWAKPNEITRKTYNENTYIMFDEATTWESAKKYCEEIGGHLATVTDASEWAFVSEFVKTSGDNDRYYLGASDSENEGEWKWVTGEPFNFTAWSTGNPDNSSYIQDYLHIWYGKTNPSWDDIQPIYNLAGFICEIENLTPTSSMIYNGHLYQMYDKDIDWRAARKYCEKIGGHLVTISDSAENEAVLNFTKAYATTSKWYWLGGTDEEEGVWKWVTDEEWSYTNWATGEPTNSDGKEHYLHMYYNSDTLKGQWNDIPIKWGDNGFICEFDSIEPVATTTHNGHEYRLYDISCTWENAKEYCENIGGYLATVISAEEQQQIETLIGKGSKNQYWLGGTDRETEGVWKWLTGESWNYTNWITGQPDNSRDKEHYLQIYKNAHPNTANSQYKWNDSPNDNIVEPYSFFSKNSVGFICEFGNTDTYTPVGSFIHNGHYYEIYDNSLHWNYARDYCEQNGGHLVTITDEEEQNAIISALDKYSTIQHYWLGLTDLNETGTYKWITGENTDYMNFPEGRPNKDDKHWVDLSIVPNQKGYWYDYYSTYDGMGFICEYETIEKIGYTVTYDANGGENLSKLSELVEKNKNADLTVTAQRLGYTFLGWNTDKNAAEPLGECVVTGDVTLYAVWEEKDAPVVIFDANGGENAPGIQSHNFGEPFVLTSEIPQREEYVFVGWATDNNAAVPEYMPGEEYICNDTLQLYAIWKYEKSGELGNNISWNIANGVLKISGNGEMPDYTAAENAPWYEYRAGISEAVLDENISVVGDYAFYGLSAVKSVSMPGITSIGEYAFSNCVSLETVDLTGIKSIGSYAFRYCKAMKELTVPKTIGECGINAFSNCNNLEKVEFENGSQIIYKGMFTNCGTIKMMLIPTTVQKADTGATDGAVIRTLCYKGSEAEFAKADLSSLNYDRLICNCDTTVYTLSEVTQNGVLINVINKDLLTESAQVISALYDENGRLLEVQKKDINGETTDVNFDAEVKKNYTVKVFVWSSVDFMRPVTQIETLNIREDI